MIRVFSPHLALVLIWLMAFHTTPAYAGNWLCSFLERRAQAKMDFEAKFLEPAAFEKYKKEATELLGKSSFARSELEARLERGESLESIMPKEPLGIAAYFEVFANHRSNNKIEVGKYLTVPEAEIPAAIRSSVKKLKKWLDSNPIGEIKLQDGKFRLKKQSRKWYKLMERYVNLAYTVETYSKLTSYENRNIRQKLTDGFLIFLKQKRAAYKQRRLVEMELMNVNFEAAVTKLGMMNQNGSYVKMRRILRRYKNAYNNIFNAIIFGGMTLGFAQLGLPINTMFIASGIVPGLIRYELTIPKNQRERILRVVREKGYEAGLKEIQPYFKNRARAAQTSMYVRKAFRIALVGLLVYLAKEWGPLAYGGLMRYLEFRQLMDNPEQLAEEEAKMTNEDIRIELLEGKIVEYPDAFGVYPEEDPDRFAGIVRAAEFINEVALYDLIKFICDKKHTHLDTRTKKDEFIDDRYDQVIISKQLERKFMVIVGRTIIDLWGQHDINKLRGFSEATVKTEVNFCEGKYRPALFYDDETKTQKSVEQAILDFL